MKNLKLFEEFNNGSNLGDKIKKQFNKLTFPEEPFKRKLTNEEIKLMNKYFKYHSWSPIDAQGRIILGGGKSYGGRFYITENDLNKLMKLDNN